MNTITGNNYFYQKAIRDYQHVRECIGQGLKILEEGNNQHNKPVKDDFIKEKLVTNLNAGIGRMISSESVLTPFGWGKGFFNNMKQVASNDDNK